MADTDLAMTRGDTWTRTITVVDAANARVNLTGKTLTFTARTAAGGTAVVTKTTGSGIVHATQSGATEGQATLTLDPADTSALAAYATTLVCDVQLTDGSARYTVIPAPGDRFTLTVYPDITTS